MRAFIELHENTAELVKFLRPTKIGQSHNYRDLSKLIGRRVDAPDGRHYLDSARRILAREGIYFSPMNDHGIRGLMRMNEEQKLAHGGEGGRKRIRRIARRGIKCLRTINTQELSSEKRSLVYIEQATMGAISQFASHQTIAEAERSANTTQTDTVPGVDHIVDLVRRRKPKS